MVDLASLLAAPGLEATLYPPSSRYYGLGTMTFTANEGTEHTYLKRRFVPAPHQFSRLASHKVEARDRPDTIAATFFGDPTQYWRICDANGAIRPNELTQTLQRILTIGALTMKAGG
jgi:hypothetical protein